MKNYPINLALPVVSLLPVRPFVDSRPHSFGVTLDLLSGRGYSDTLTDRPSELFQLPGLS